MCKNVEFRTLLQKKIFLDLKDYSYQAAITPLAGFTESHSSVLTQSIIFTVFVLLFTTIGIVFLYSCIKRPCDNDPYDNSNSGETRLSVVKEPFLTP